MSTRIKIGKQILAKVIKESFMENGYNEKDAVYISENVIRRLDEIGYRGAALTKGANYNARQQYNNNISTVNNRQKMERSRVLDLPALNQSISSNFPNLEIHFIKEEQLSMSYPITFYFEEIKRIDNNSVVIGGIIKSPEAEKSFKGSIEYNFNKGIFYQVNFYGKGSIRRLFPLMLDTKDIQYKNTAHNFLSFVSNYLYSVEDYQNNVNNTQ